MYAVRRAIRFANRFATILPSIYRNRARRDNLPRLLTHTVTFRCNARCIMCDSWKMSGAQDLSTSEIEGIYRQLPVMDAVRLTGGEPFVRSDIREILNLVERYLRPVWVHITSNGFLTDRIVELCETRNRDVPMQLLISLDGVGEKHNTLRGNTHAWSSAMETLQSLAPRRRELRLDLAVNQTIVDREGVEHYRKLRELLKPLGVRHQAVMAYERSATYSVERDIDLAPKKVGQFLTFGQFENEHLRELFDAMEEDLRELPWGARLAKAYYLKGIRNRLLEDRAAPNPVCVALNSHMRLFPNGDVPTCQFNSRIVGSLRNQTFKEIWKSQRAAEQRKWVRNCVGCWAECEVLPNAIYSLDLLN